MKVHPPLLQFSSFVDVEEKKSSAVFVLLGHARGEVKVDPSAFS